MAYPVEQPDPTKVVGRRVVAAILDAFLVIVPALLLISASFEYLEVDDLGMDPDTFCDQFLAQNDGICVNFEDVDDRVYFDESTNLSGSGVYWLSNILFLVVLQGLTGWTPGKLITGIRVRKEAGGPPGLLKALIRWVLWIADGFPYVLPGLTGFIVALSTPGHRRVGDMAASTFVVKRAAMDTPLSIEDGGRVLVGEQAAAVTVPAWAPPPSAPGAAAGWGAPSDPGAAGWASPEGAAPPPPATAPAPTPTPGTEGPQWDEARGTYIQWDPAQRAWMQWDEGFKAWTRIPGQ